MTRWQIVFYTGCLVVIGAGWGFASPMTKLSVSTGYQHFGLIFWQMAIGSVLMAVIVHGRGRSLPLRPRHLKVYAIIAAIGTVIPNSASYQAAVHLPAGVMAILYSTIPMLAFPIALALSLDRFRWRRFVGLLFGLVAVSLITVPTASFVGAIPAFWVLILLITCLCYGFEGNYVAKWGTEGLDALQVLYGASLLGMIATLPLALGSGQWIDPRGPWTVADWALIAGSVAHVLVYAGYVWLVGAAGPVFAVQVSYLVTIFGVFWAKLILDEAYAPLVWVSLGLMMLGMYLVQPRRGASLAEDGAMRDAETTR